MNRNELKILKKLDTFNADAKNIFHRYYLKYNGEATSSLEDLKDQDSANYIKFAEDMMDVFELLHLQIDDVLYIDSYALFKALSKRTKIKHIAHLDGKVVVVSTDTSLINVCEELGWFHFNGEINIPVARIERVNKCTKAFTINSVDLDVSEMHDVSHLIEPILAKNRVAIMVDDQTLYIGKPLLPTLNNKCKLYARFFPLDDDKFLARICVNKEHVFNYHTFIAFSI